MKQVGITDARIGQDVDEFVFLGFTNYKNFLDGLSATDQINIDYIQQQLGLAYQEQRLYNLLSQGGENIDKQFNQDYFKQFQQLNNELGVFILNTITRMYYQTLEIDKEKVVVVDKKSPYTTGRSITDVLQQIRPFIPNMQQLFGELLDQKYDKNISINILQHELKQDAIDMEHNLGKDLIGKNGQSKTQQLSKQ